MFLQIKKNPKSFFHFQTTQTFIGLSLVLEIGTKVRQKMALTMSYLKVLLLNLHTAVLNIQKSGNSGKLNQWHQRAKSFNVLVSLILIL